MVQRESMMETARGAHGLSSAIQHLVCMLACMCTHVCVVKQKYQS